MQEMFSVSSKKISFDRRRNSFHLVFVTKKRYDMFRRPDIAFLLKEFFKGICNKYGLVLHALEVASNHVHMFVDIPVKMSLYHAIRLLKALSAKCMFMAFPNMKKRYPKGRLWSSYKYWESIGKVTASKIEKYIKESQQKHKQENAWITRRQTRNADA